MENIHGIDISKQELETLMRLHGDLKILAEKIDNDRENETLEIFYELKTSLLTIKAINTLFDDKDYTESLIRKLKILIKDLKE